MPSRRARVAGRGSRERGWRAARSKGEPGSGWIRTGIMLNRSDAKEIAMARIHCTLVEASVMPTGFEIGSEDQVSPPVGGRLVAGGRFESRPEPGLLRLASLGRPLYRLVGSRPPVATGAMLPHALGRADGPGAGASSAPRSRWRWMPDRFGRHGKE